MDDTVRFKVTHTLHNSRNELVAEIEEWSGVDGPYLAFRYRREDWSSARNGSLLWAMRDFLDRQAKYLALARLKVEREWHRRAIQEGAWALASWADGRKNWVES